MSTTAQKLCIEALSLPRKVRTEIAERLIASLEDEPDVRSEKEWKEIIRCRRREIREGKAKLIPADEVMAKALRAIS